MSRFDILDVCCGPKMFWFNKNHPKTIYMDNRIRNRGYSKSRPNRRVNPDIVANFKQIPFRDSTFGLVVMDPPHLFAKGEFFEMAKTYGYLDKDSWFLDIRNAINECWRVLKENGVLIFKWNEASVKRDEVLKAIGEVPLFGHPVLSKIPTHWFCFMKTTQI